MKIWSRCIAQNMNKKIWKILPKVFMAKVFKFFIHILGNVMTLYFHFEIYWPLAKKSIWDFDFFHSIFWNFPKQSFFSYFCNDDYRASISIHELEEQTCYGPHFTQNNGGVRVKLPFEKVYQPYNGPTIRKLLQYLSEWYPSPIWVNTFIKLLVNKLWKPSRKNTI